MSSKTVIFSVLFSIATVSAHADKSKVTGAPAVKDTGPTADRYGTSVLDSKELFSKVTIVDLQGNASEATIRDLQKATHGKGPIAIDDQSPDHPVWMYETKIANQKVRVQAGELALHVEFVGVNGTKHERLEEAVSPAHLVVVLVKGDETKEQLAEAKTAIESRLRSDRKDAILFQPAKAGGPALLGEIIKTIKSGKAPGVN
jgi:hypothetical protein